MSRVEVSTIPSIILLLRSKAEEAATKSALLEHAGAFTPRIEDQSTDTEFLCVLDTAGTENLFGPPTTLAKRILEGPTKLGIVAYLAMSSNLHAAICLARGMTSTNRVIVIPNGDEANALAALPLEVLNLPEHHAETFSLWGIHNLGMLAALPEVSLVARMGQDGKRFRQLARGELQHFFSPLEPVFTIEERFELESPLGVLDSLLFVVSVMLEQLTIKTSARVLAIAALTLTLSLEDGEIYTRTIKPALPTNDRQFWIKLIHLDLEAHPPGVAVLALTITAEPGPTSKVQLGLFSPQLPEAKRLDVTLASIRSIVGEECVGRAVLKDVHRPDGYRVEPFTLPINKPLQAVGRRDRTVMRLVDSSKEVIVGIQNERPQTIFFQKTHYAVVHAYGPWLVSGDWWGQEHWHCEQWDVVARSGDTVLCCCMLRELKQHSWRMAGLYD